MSVKRPSFWPAALALIFVLLGSEAIVRRWIHLPSAYAFDPRFGPITRPGARLLQSTEGYGLRTANSFGFLGREPRTPRAHLRVVLFGDSFAEALHVREDQSFPSIAERSIPDAEIINLGRSASFPANYAAEMATFDSLLAPNLIVVEVNDGDVREILNPALMEQVRRYGRAREEFRPPSIGRWVVSHSGLASLAKNRMDLLVEKERTRLSKKLGLGRVGYVESMSGPVDPRASVILDSLYTLMRDVGRPIVFLYIPDLNYLTSPPAHRYPTRREFFLAFAARNGVLLVDPTNAMLTEYQRTRQPLQGFQNSVLGDGHLNVRGHAVIGPLLARAIVGAKR
jgi:hypothetical protein